MVAEAGGGREERGERKGRGAGDRLDQPTGDRRVWEATELFVRQ